VGGVRPRDWIGSISLFQYRDSTGVVLAAVEVTILVIILVQGVLVRLHARGVRTSLFNIWVISL
jgi:hypothetical protein